MLDSAPVLCPTPEEPTRSRSCLPQSEKTKTNVVNSEGTYHVSYFDKGQVISKQNFDVTVRIA